MLFAGYDMGEVSSTLSSITTTLSVITLVINVMLVEKYGKEDDNLWFDCLLCP